MLNQNRDEKIKSEFKVIRTRQLAVTLPLIPVMFFVIFWGDKTPPITIMGIQIVWIGLVMAALCLIFSLWHWRCPACKRYLGKQINPKYCSKCGVELR
jgi:hypothetical protein